MTALYHADKNQLMEQPGIEKPIEPKQGLARSSYDLAMGRYKEACIKYNVHLASLRTINCHSSCKGLWPDKSLLEEGRDYEVREALLRDERFPFLAPKGSAIAFPLTVKSEDQDEVWASAMELYITAKNLYPFSPEKWISVVKEKYSLTKR